MTLRNYTPPNGSRLVRRIATELRAALRAGRPVYVTLQSTEAPLERARLRVEGFTHHRDGSVSWLSDSSAVYPAPMWTVTVVEWQAGPTHTR